MAKKQSRSSGRESFTAPIPGRRPKLEPGMRTYIVELKERDSQDSDAPVSRQELYSSGIARTTAFRRQLEQWLSDQKLQEQVQHIGEPTVFPMLGVACTETVAEQIRTMADVESVAVDVVNLGRLSR